MRLSAVARKSISDLTRRRAPALFAVAALALAVASVGLFALPTLMSRAMDREIAANKLADVTITVKPLALTGAELHALGSLPNVVAFDPRSTFSTKVYDGARRERTVLIGSFHLVSGRLLTPADARSGAPVVAVEQDIARATNTHIGQRVIVRTKAGNLPFTVVGIVSDQQQNGTVLFAPLTTMQSVLHTPGAVNEYWIQTTSGNHHLIDQTNTRLEDAFAAHGLQIATQIEYVGAANDRATYRGVTTAITVLGLLIVAISMAALINTLTMVVLERTREIGILRCIGAHARDVRRIFATEGLTIALAGGLIGIPLGFGLAHAVVSLAENVFNEHLLFAFPALNIPLALVGSFILALAAMQIPLRRAVRFKPGEALRYA